MSWLFQPLPGEAQLLAATGSITGTASLTLDPLTMSGAGTLAIAGTASLTLAPLTMSGAATLAIAGAASLTLAALTMAGTATLGIIGSSSLALGALVMSSGATLAIAGAAALTLGALTMTATATTGAAAVPAITTTVEGLRDYIIGIIRALTPDALTGNKYHPYRNEGAARFMAWCATNPAGCLRRYQVRDSGGYDQASVSNTELEERTVTFETLVAYPQSNRAGKYGALDRDDLMRQDQHKIETAIGVLAWAVFLGEPRATWLGGRTSRRIEQGVDFLVITQQMRFYRTA